MRERLANNFQRLYNEGDTKWVFRLITARPSSGRPLPCPVWKTGHEGPCGLVLVGDVFQDILHPAVQDLAQGVQCGGGDGLAVLHAVDGVGVHALLVDQVVFCDAFAEQGLIEGSVADHVISPLLKN